MNTTETVTNTEQPRSYTLERWIAFFLSLLFLLPFVAQGQSLQNPLPTTTLDANEGATLLLKTSQPGRYVVAPAVKSEVDIKVFGPIVRTTVRQTFHNATGQCVEGIYVYPLPETSAVDTLRMTIGSRVVEGEVREREEARQEYEKAVKEGRRAALVEQHRPNVFTTLVASLLPGEDAVIEIGYQEMARFEAGEYRLRFPMVVAPRYTPAQTAMNSSVAPPDSGLNLPGANVAMTVELRPGSSIRDIVSAHHHVTTETLGDRHYRVTLDDPNVPSDQDFELSWRPDAGSDPGATILTERDGNDTFAIVTVTPPEQSAVRLPRETIFIIDSSGSMMGASMEQAKAALLLALDDLRPGDRFNIIDFDSTARTVFPGSRFADPAAVEDARRFVGSIVADGGTEMLSALRLAFPETIAAGTDMVRQVIFMTDGQVGNEQELFTYLRAHLGESRLFTVGIGAAPNSHFMRNAARFGRGTFTYIGDREQVKERMAELFTKIDSPVLTAIEVKSTDAATEIWPARLPDLYRGEPLVVAIRLHEASGTIALSGHAGGQVWRKELTLPPPASEGIGRLWGRQKIETLMDGLSEGQDPNAVRSEVVEVALRHHLTSQYTSLVAVDKTPQGLTGATCQSTVLPIAGPPSADSEGTLPQTATPAAMLLLLGFLLIGLALAAARLTW
jgi:Ca-activated chloride channel family protein